MEKLSEILLSGKIRSPILIAGAQGLLGSEFAQVLAQGPEDGFLALGRNELNILDAGNIERVLREVQPAIVLNCAAYTAVDKAESEKEEALLLNGEGPALLAEACHRHEAKLVHFSTDYVFDGNATTPRDEEDEPHPINWYAETKLRGENAVLDYPENLCLRVQWVYGAKRDRFSSLIQYETFTPFDDQRGAPTWTRDIVEMTLRLLAQGASGLYHISHDDSATWFEIYQFVKETLQAKTQLRPVPTAEANLPARRPLYSVLSNQKLCQTLHLPGLGSWKPRLKEFLHQQQSIE